MKGAPYNGRHYQNCRSDDNAEDRGQRWRRVGVTRRMVAGGRDGKLVASGEDEPALKKARTRTWNPVPRDVWH